MGALAELVRAARRANVTFYPVDPRGLTAAPPIHANLTMDEWQEYVTTTVSSLQVLGDETGGFCICNTNDFSTGLKRIDSETSDYYMLGYSSTNPDPLKRTRKIEVKVVDRPGVSVWSRTSYSLRQIPNAGK